MDAATLVRSLASPTALFVLLWSSGAIASRWALDHASPLPVLVLRFSLALAALLVLCGLRGKPWLPPPEQRGRVLVSGATLIGGYSLCYFQAMQEGLTPGVLATLLGIQPILTLLLMERRFSPWRLLGLLVSLAGLALVVLRGVDGVQLPASGLLFALLALLAMTGGSIVQKGTVLPPDRVLPLQFVVTLLMCALAAPFQSWRIDDALALTGPVLWLALVISVGAQLLLYRLIAAGNLVNVTSLFYLVPVVTALMDWLLLGNRLGLWGVAGMTLVVAGLWLVFGKRGKPIVI